MEVQVMGPFAESDGINPITTRQFAHKPACLLHSGAPRPSFKRIEIDGATKMAARVEKEPTQERRWIRVMTQDPKTRSSDFIPTNHGLIGMQLTNTTGEMAVSRLSHHNSPVAGNRAAVWLGNKMQCHLKHCKAKQTSQF